MKNKYAVWQMDVHGTSRRIARCETLADANAAITDGQRDMGFVYIMSWTTVRNPIQLTIETTSRYIIGWLDGWKHTNDMRATVRNVLCGAR